VPTTKHGNPESPDAGATPRLYSSANEIQKRLEQFLSPDLFKLIDVNEARHCLNNVPVEKVAAFLSEQLGKSPHPEFAQWADYRIKMLEAFNIRQDVARLETLGLRKEVLAIAMMAINLSPGLDNGFQEIFGDKKTRNRYTKALLAPIPVLKLFAANFDELYKQFPRPSMPNASKVTSDLNMFASGFLVIEKVYEFLGTRSILEASKFALASLVKTTSARYLDREVSALTGAALQKEDYDETSHRVWRIRNYQRLHETCPFVTTVVIALNQVLSQA